jgi:hypothetical protein
MYALSTTVCVICHYTYGSRGREAERWPCGTLIYCSFAPLLPIKAINYPSRISSAAHPGPKQRVNMLAVVTSIAWAVCVMGTLAADDAGYLVVENRDAAGIVQRQIERYVPHEGDLILFDDHNPTWRFLYHMAGTDLPDHSGIVFTLPDGRPAFLESAPDDGKLAGLYVRLLLAQPRLHQFQGTIYIRRVRHPLSAERSARLTQFALAQEGKRYAVGRMLLQGTPFRCRTGLRAKLFARTSLDRWSWFCSELVIAAGTAAGLFDPHVHHANAMYPRDLLYDDHYDLSATWLPAAVWTPNPSTAANISQR